MGFSAEPLERNLSCGVCAGIDLNAVLAERRAALGTPAQVWKMLHYNPESPIPLN